MVDNTCISNQTWQACPHTDYIVDRWIESIIPDIHSFVQAFIHSFIPSQTSLLHTTSLTFAISSIRHTHVTYMFPHTPFDNYNKRRVITSKRQHRVTCTCIYAYVCHKCNVCAQVIHECSGCISQSITLYVPPPATHQAPLTSCLTPLITPRHAKHCLQLHLANDLVSADCSETR